MKLLGQYPLLMAALVAACGVSLILVSSVWPADAPGSEPDRSLQEQLHQRHLEALSLLRRAGLAGDVEVADFGDGLGLAAARGASKGMVLFTVPEALALDVERAPSCLAEAEGDEASVACKVETQVVKAVAKKDATRLTGLIALLVMERRRGQATGLERGAASAVLDVLPELKWQDENGIFAVEDDEFRLLSAGTSMETWRDLALRRTEAALRFIQGTLAPLVGEDVSMEEVRWAYLVLHSYGQWAEKDTDEDDAELPAQVLFLWPLFLARPTPEWQHGADLRYNADQRLYEVVAPRSLRAGEEVLFVDRRLTDASALCYRGLWLSGRHRARLVLNVSSVARDPQSQPLLQKYGCGGQPLLRLYVQARKSVDPHFLSCMRMLALAGNATKLQHVEKRGWMATWPDTGVIGRHSEAAAAELAVALLQQVLSRLGGSSSEIRQRYGSDAVAAHPTVRVREAETMVVVGLLKSMKELQLLSGNEYLFEALGDAQKKPKKRKKREGSAQAPGTEAA